MGYTIVNDVTARDLQRTHKRWLLGKSLDTHCPMGPYAVSADEITDVTALVVESHVNGERRQSAPVKDLILDIPELIATGTPAGVGIGFDPPRFMAGGDVIEVSITGLGAQRAEDTYFSEEEVAAAVSEAHQLRRRRGPGRRARRLRDPQAPSPNDLTPTSSKFAPASDGTPFALRHRAPRHRGAPPEGAVA